MKNNRPLLDRLKENKYIPALTLAAVSTMSGCAHQHYQKPFEATPETRAEAAEQLIEDLLSRDGISDVPWCDIAQERAGEIARTISSHDEWKDFYKNLMRYYQAYEEFSTGRMDYGQLTKVAKSVRNALHRYSELFSPQNANDLLACHRDLLLRPAAHPDAFDRSNANYGSYNPAFDPYGLKRQKEEYDRKVEEEFRETLLELKKALRDRRESGESDTLYP